MSGDRDIPSSLLSDILDRDMAMSTGHMHQSMRTVLPDLSVSGVSGWTVSVCHSGSDTHSHGYKMEVEPTDTPPPT